MAWIAAAAAIGGALLSSNKAGSAQNSQERASQAGIASQERMFDKQLSLQEPYREAGYQALGGLQDLTSPEGRASMLSDYYGGAEFQGLRGQEEEQQLRNAAATGGIRGGVNQAGLASITPRLGQQYLSNQYNQLTGLANMGQGAASQGVQGAQNLGFQTSQLLQQQGEAQAQGALAQANIWGNALGTVAGSYKDYRKTP